MKKPEHVITLTEGYGIDDKTRTIYLTQILPLSPGAIVGFVFAAIILALILIGLNCWIRRVLLKELGYDDKQVVEVKKDKIFT